MTTIAVTLNNEDVGTAKCKEITVNGMEMEERTWTLLLLNEEDALDGLWEGGDVVDIDIDGVDILDGYIDDFEPYTDSRFSGMSLMKVTGICTFFDLSRLTVDKVYTEEKLDDLFEASITEAGAEITFTSPSAGPAVSAAFRDTYVKKKWRELCEAQGYTFHVENGKALQLYALGAVGQHLSLNLTLEGASTDNIIRLLKGEYARGVFNWVKLTAGPVKDHWSCLNADDYDGADANTVVTDETDDGDFFGKGKIKATRANTNGPIAFELDFSGTLYHYSSLDLSVYNQFSYMIYPHFTGLNGYRRCRVQLTDGSGNVIEYRRHISFLNPAPRHNRTDSLTIDRWYKVEVPHGVPTAEISDARSRNEVWSYVTKIDTFDWTDVVKIGWATLDDATVGEYLYLDLLSIPMINCIAIAEDSTSQTDHRKRDLPQNRFDIPTQVELTIQAEAMVAAKKEPLKKMTLICEGQTDIKYAGPSLDVQSTFYGIGSLTKYRILGFTHRVTTAGRKVIDGYSFTTEVDLILHDDGGTVRTDKVSILLPMAPQALLGEYLDGSLRPNAEFERELFPDHNWSIPGDVPTGASFPTDPLDGDIYNHTGHGYQFGWDDANSRWVAIDYINNAQSGVTADSESTGVTADRELAGMNAWKALAAMTADRETSGVVTDDIDDRSINQTASTTLSVESIDKAWEDIHTFSPSQDCEEAFVQIQAQARDATPSFLQFRVKVGSSDYYPGSSGIYSMPPLQHGMISWVFHIPRNVNGESVILQAQQAGADEELWWVVSHIWLVATHNHGITEPNAGAGHDTALTEPNSGAGHDTALIEPNSGQGHDTALTDPGHATDLNEPNAGAGHGGGEGGGGHNTYETADP